MPDKNELLRKSDALKSEISKLKRELSSISSKKRELYAKYDELKGPFHAVIGKIKEFRHRRDVHTAFVKELKTKRKAATSEAKIVTAYLEKLRSEKEKKSKTLGVRRPAFSVASEIEKLEYKIETGAIPFEEEKRLTKVIKEKKEELKKAEQLSDVIGKLKASSKKLNVSQSKSNESHRELQLHASVSQKLHEEMLSHVKKADEIKAKVKPIEKELSDIRENYSELKSQLQQKLSDLLIVSKELDKIKAEEEKQHRAEKEKIIAAKEKELTDKIKSGKKITRDDLIMLQ